MPPGHPLLVRMKEEHEHIRELILNMDEEADKRTLVLLADLVNHHIRFEERELFAWLESNLAPDKLDQIFEQLEKHPVHDDTWTDEFWISKPK